MSTRKTIPQPQTPTTSPTRVCTVQSAHFSQAPLAAHLSDLDEIAAAHASDEFERLIDRIITRDIIPLSPFDQVEVIDHALTTVLVRVLDGAERGRQGWIPSSWLHGDGRATISSQAPIAAAAA
jgi:hypothetical protein